MKIYCSKCKKEIRGEVYQIDVTEWQTFYLCRECYFREDREHKISRLEQKLGWYKENYDKEDWAPIEAEIKELKKGRKK